MSTKEKERNPLKNLRTPTGMAEKMDEHIAKQMFLRGSSIEAIMKETGVARFWLMLKIPQWQRSRI